MKSSHAGKGFGQWLWWCPTPAIPTVPPAAVGCLVRSQPSASLDGVPCWVTAIGYLIGSLPLRVVGGVVHLAAAVAAIGVVCPLLCCHRWWVLCPAVVITVGAWWVTVAKGAPPLPWVSPCLSSWSYGAPPWSSSWLWVLSWPWVPPQSLSWPCGAHPVIVMELVPPPTRLSSWPWVPPRSSLWLCGACKGNLAVPRKSLRSSKGGSKENISKDIIHER